MAKDPDRAREPVYVIAKYDYNASSDQELSLRKNERLRLVDDSKQWWKVENAKYQSGFVPSNYVKKEKPSLLNSLKRHVKKKTADMKINHISAPIPPAQSYLLGPHPNGVPNRPFAALVKFNYDPSKADELQLKKGEYILVIEKSHDGWWKGQNKANSARGWFPSNYVKEMPHVNDALAAVEPDNRAEPVTSYAPSDSPNPNEHFVQALYSYTAQSADELTFEKNERLLVFDAPTSETNWFRARNERGEIGLVPRNYVEDIYLDTVPVLRHSGGQNGEENVPEELMDEMSAMHLNGTTNGRSSDPTVVYDDFVDRGTLHSKLWYFGRISRQDCDSLLNAYGDDGDYLIRDSETGNKADFSVSLKASPRNKHFRVYVNAVECHLTIGQRRFNSLEEMIRHYERHPICTNNDGRKLTLNRPLNAPRTAVVPA
ncbi:cytoplasmic protein NCK2-like [Paramacrobiotus metropolitanus]|uniref:cytoplasmic protein NCK2-like n=1 Tax=Paramacrobiotus metropolitanus TaxID=2943436 RepID=UPI0024456F4C|nr:cytoplasmic protein NCK2-like [Paramacrobiotus metropolitanus]XP_055344366.1 cytoplasmic protein NCK2-like [Paramacrobiotus metropolitanus]